MKKIESARIVEKRNGNCEGLRCFGCFNEKWCDNKKSYRAEVYQQDKLKLAQAYIKRHEGKSKKRIIPKYTADIQPDKTGSVLNKIVTLPKDKPTPLDIAKAIRDNGYRCEYTFKRVCLKERCPLYLRGCGSMDEDADKTLKDLRKQLIDDYIAKNDHIVDKHEKVEPKPISFDVPDVVYTTMDNGIMFVNTKGKNMGIVDGKLTVGINECYRTPEEALAVALKRWGSK